MPIDVNLVLQRSVSTKAVCLGQVQHLFLSSTQQNYFDFNVRQDIESRSCQGPQLLSLSGGCILLFRFQSRNSPHPTTLIDDQLQECFGRIFFLQASRETFIFFPNLEFPVSQSYSCLYLCEHILNTCISVTFKSFMPKSMKVNIFSSAVIQNQFLIFFVSLNEHVFSIVNYFVQLSSTTT